MNFSFNQTYNPTVTQNLVCDVKEICGGMISEPLAGLVLGMLLINCAVAIFWKEVKDVKVFGKINYVWAVTIINGVLSIIIGFYVYQLI